MRRRTLFTLSATAVAAAGLSACGSAVTGKKSSGSGSGKDGTVKVGHLPSSLFAPLYVADATKEFEKAGITIELVPLKSGQDGIPMLGNGKLDVMVAGFSAGMFNALHEGIGFTVVGSMGISPGDEKNSPSALEASAELMKDGSISSVEDLKGRKVGVAGGPGATGGYLLATMLEKGGLDLTDVEVVNLSTPDQEPALTNGSVDAALPSAPFSTSMEKAGVAQVLAVPDKGVTGTGVIYSEDFTGSDLAQPFFTALAAGGKKLADDGEQTDEVYDILAKATGQKVAVLKSSPMYSYLPDLAPQPDQLEAMQTVWMKAEQITYDKPQDVADFVEEKFAKGAAG